MNTAVLISALLGASGVVGAFVAFVKLKPERESIIVTAAQGAVVVQSSVIEDLANELKRTQEQFAALEADLRVEMAAMNDELRNVTEERDRLDVENGHLRRRLDEVEGQAAILAAQVERLERNGTTDHPV